MTQKELDILTNIIGAVETGGQVYGKRKYEAYIGAYKNNKNEVTCSLGWAQNYGANARKLVQMIFDADKTTFRKIDKNTTIEKKLKTDWVATKWNPNETEKALLIALITSDIGKECQDKLFQDGIKVSVADAEALGISDVGSQMMYCEIRHLGGKTPTERIFNRITKPYTVDKVFESLIKDQQDTSNNNQVGDKIYQSRHECCVKWIKQYVENNTATSSTTKNTQIDPIGTVISIAENELGYLEKKSNAQLDDKTSNAGSNNYTKYWRDVYPQYQGQAWCACFVSWCFMKAFGLESAKKLLKHWPYVYCPTLGDLFTRYANPQVGDIVIFYRNGTFTHTGIVIKVSGDQFWTIEGNTSAGSSVIENGGGVFKKTYYNSQLPGTKFCRPDYSIVSSIASNSSVTTSSTTSSGSTSQSTALKIGSKGQTVIDLQNNLNKLGYNLIVNGDFGQKTEAAVKAFQKKYSITVDGIVGTQTYQTLNKAISGITQDNVQSSSKSSYMVKIEASALNIRKGPGTQYDIVGCIKDRGIYTIVEEKNGWGKLKSGAGWINLDYTQRV